MKPGTDSPVFLSSLCPFAKADRAVCTVELCGYATRIQESARLIQLGARAGLVAQLTGLEKTTVNRLYRQLHGEPSPPGQMPFTDTWYRAHDRRMLQATLVWRLQHRLLQTGRSAARALIDAYEAYEKLIGEPLFDLTRLVHVPRLVNMETWHERPCQDCGTPFLSPVDCTKPICPGCRLYHRHRCRDCGFQLPLQSRGRRREICPQCGFHKHRGRQR
ncbi:FlhC family transcriptional regulator [Aquamicrobium sp.]|uniref:FlhC family transcriptional regulator n=1 Tax=Aquamicrobium sp. TaxID=1872579 RepID=UPI00258CF696|nr:FlhC family transcriptional regulator [Aquamicrobium sp.]MCK9553175.1 FlhC family transcriptional regulator [Aquamicrobium sp.]